MDTIICFGIGTHISLLSGLFSLGMAVYGTVNVLWLKEVVMEREGETDRGRLDDCGDFAARPLDGMVRMWVIFSLRWALP